MPRVPTGDPSDRVIKKGFARGKEGRDDRAAQLKDGLRTFHRQQLFFGRSKLLQEPSVFLNKLCLVGSVQNAAVRIAATSLLSFIADSAMA
jgi:hypothetical protein